MVAKDNTRHRNNSRQKRGGRLAKPHEFTKEEMMWPFPVAPLRIPGLPKFNPNNLQDAPF